METNVHQSSKRKKHFNYFTQTAFRAITELVESILYFRNLVGNEKGQGQNKATLVDRQHKNENKSSRANHNRRQGAAFKRNRGMIPS